MYAQCTAASPNSSWGRISSSRSPHWLSHLPLKLSGTQSEPHSNVTASVTASHTRQQLLL
eukprot:935395-Rhodomonas_salina.1